MCLSNYFSATLRKSPPAIYPFLLGSLSMERNKESPDSETTVTVLNPLHFSLTCNESLHYSKRKKEVRDLENAVQVLVQPSVQQQDEL